MDGKSTNFVTHYICQITIIMYLQLSNMKITASMETLQMPNSAKAYTNHICCENDDY